MNTYTITPEEFATGEANRKASKLFKYRNWKVKPWERPPLAKPAGLERQIGTITTDQFSKGDAFNTGKRRLGHRQMPSSAIKPMEAVMHALPDTGLTDLPKTKKATKPAKPGDDIEPPGHSLDEARLPDILLDLADIYGNAFPRPRGNIIQFTLVDENTTYEKAAAKIQEVLDRQGVNPTVTITPGPEVIKPWNRSIILLFQKNTLM
jgi:hypothetical protein